MRKLAMSLNYFSEPFPPTALQGRHAQRVRALPKVLGHFLCPNSFGILGRKGGGLTKSKIVGPFSPKLLVKYDNNKKVPKSFEKEKAYGKVPQKFQNSWGGVRPSLENTQIKAAFLFVRRP